MKVHRSNQELQDTIEGYKMLLEEQKKEIWRLQQIASENEKNINYDATTICIDCNMLCYTSECR